MANKSDFDENSVIGSSNIVYDFKIKSIDLKVSTFFLFDCFFLLEPIVDLKAYDYLFCLQLLLGSPRIFLSN